MIIGYYNLANLVTLLTVAMSILAGYLALNGYFPLAMILMLMIVDLDAADGILARKFNRDQSETVRQYGANLDTAADLVNYSLAPIVVGVAVGFGTFLDWLIYTFLAICLVIRLANFNLVRLEDRGGSKYFRGFPSTYINVVVPTAFAVGDILAIPNPNYLMRAVYLVLGLMFIANIPVKDIRSTKIPLILAAGILGPGVGLYWLFQLF